MMKKYESPVIEKIEISSVDIISTSGDNITTPDIELSGTELPDNTIDTEW